MVKIPRTTWLSYIKNRPIRIAPILPPATIREDPESKKKILKAPWGDCIKRIQEAHATALNASRRHTPGVAGMFLYDPDLYY